MHPFSLRASRLKTLLSLLLIATCASASAFKGDYTVDGRNPDGSGYKGSVSIDVKPDGTCAIAWAIQGKSFSGRCMARGRSLAASYASGATHGLVVYEMNATGQIAGTWDLPGTKGLGEERLTPRH